MNFRTDLALERRQMLGENLSGVKVREIQGEETKTTVIDIDTSILPSNIKGKYIKR